MKNNYSISPDFQSIKKGEKVSDRLVWHSCREGNKKALESIYDSNYNLLLNVGFKIVPILEVVEDHIQDLFLYIWKNRTSIEIKSNMRVYLLKSLRNNLIKYAQKTRNLTSDEHLNHIPENTIENQNEFGGDELKVLVDNLPQKQMEIIYLKFFQNFEGAEIAEIMNISIGTAYNLLSRAIRNLKKNAGLLTVFCIFI
ncbi:sigma-70 family RNA polymerase sigma factor [Reichenbachiella carrageenanivorans]|uniref:Sigma-70 family RNA polymerase sigma factor n=1 Tax=Reichenbachiella carrageenanivorans TaxID=2979869 RepID=A0ABY6D6Z4_9BACT|nr:sigma-70 family RNA polymerase sigma factor [Reichenbachiella carrageenanivorans]UXX81390.1 sigma-70 family RNA polymerase sigma factor [Reichenbachiella carrageenanivorans]